AHPSIIKVINTIKAPYNINGMTQQLVSDSLRDEKFKNQMVEQTLVQKNLLAQNLENLAFVEKIFPSDANFLLVKFTDAKAVFKYLITERIIVRDRSSVRLCEDCLRISIGTAAENEKLLAVLRNYK
ncbi:MAG: aminotransferase class I/II-fold pyridoxal phosphate-dependent enzyme, partial [Verrucomicrobia bacterium]|nr:aminotransferase class I/II-fold pyridoxal phosphate-dependent enzyme [Cytophagales bacterium]